jgi:hypothetical protein
MESNIIKEVAELNKFKQPRIGQWVKNNPVPINSKNNYLSNSIEYFSLSSKVNQHSIQSMIMVSINILCVMVNKDLTTQLKATRINKRFS